MSTILTSWILTYLVHSTVVLGAAWLVSLVLGEKQLGLQEILLRTALVGGLVTAGLQAGFGFMPLAGTLTIDSIRVPESVSAVTATVNDLGVPADETAPRNTTTADRYRMNWARAVLAVWIAGSLMALLGLGRSALDLRRLLQTRRLQPAGRLLERLAVAMGLRRKVHFSTSPAIAVPFATGITRPEICCPERIHDLALEHRTALYAHELAHLARRDPAWQLLYRIGEAVFFLQPLNRLVRRRLEEIAEHLTDERAVCCTGNRLGLARCLVVIAHWGTAAPLGLPATAFAAGPRLDRRVRRLISGGTGSHRRAFWTAPLLITLLLGFAVILPLIAPTSLHADEALNGTRVAPATTWSVATDPPRPDAPTAPEPPAALAESDPMSPEPPTPETAPSPKTPPTPEAAPAAPPAPSSAPAQSVATESVAHPHPPVPPQEAISRHERTAEEERDRQRAAAGERSNEVAQLRERARALAREAARRDQNIKVRREDLRQRALAMHAAADLEDRQQERAARALAEEAREMARETATRFGRLTDEQREELRRRADQLLAKARERSQVAARCVRERARVLSEEARNLAEEAETRCLTEEELLGNTGSNEAQVNSE
jgi:beta-lactamase regulating signal transducer with metallopeptidase domain/outer membrane biosynthesis protein TonB